jgi:putative protease
MSLGNVQLELLAPARDLGIGKEAVLHGADAVYIGGPSFGARVKASNTVADIATLVQFAHRFRAKVFVAINTILHDSELEVARDLIHQYWNAGVDALIVQDMGILKLDIPPIELHASTQCDIRTVDKAKFLGDVGFSQLVLAREMTLEDIVATRAAVNPDVALEFFVHGALCVAFSGNCNISHAHTGRSANRGECAQECRLPYTLKDKDGRVVAFDKHLLSMKDNDQSANLRLLIDAGIRSFKIEGRYKDMGYVKNVTAHYRVLLDEILNERPELARCSDGQSTFTFTPDPERSFNRSSTDYFVNGRKADIGAFDAPVHLGMRVGEVLTLARDTFELASDQPIANGDGLTYLHKREVRGVHVNRAHPSGVNRYQITANVPTAQLLGLNVGTIVHRNRDHRWDATLSRPSATRKVGVAMLCTATETEVSVVFSDASGCVGEATLTGPFEQARDADAARAQFLQNFAKLGATQFVVHDAVVHGESLPRLAKSALNALRRDALQKLQDARAKKLALARGTRRPEIVPTAQYPYDSVSFLANVYNSLAKQFYAEHGVKLIAAAYEMHEEPGDVPLMVTKHCLRFSFNLCPKQAKGVTGVQGQVRADPMTLESAGETLTLKFDCKPCEMHVVGKMRTKIFRSPVPSIVPLVFHPQRAKAHL